MRIIIFSSHSFNIIITLYRRPLVYAEPLSCPAPHVALMFTMTGDAHAAYRNLVLSSVSFTLSHIMFIMTFFVARTHIHTRKSHDVGRQRVDTPPKACVSMLWFGSIVFHVFEHACLIDAVERRVDFFLLSLF